MSKGKILRAIFALALIPTGAVLTLVSSSWPGPSGQLISKLGLALIVAGVVTVFRELVILRLESEETREGIAKAVHKRLLASPPTPNGLRIVATERNGYDEYSTWAISKSPQVLFFAGRSVLHRMDYDFKKRGLGPVEKILRKRLKEGSRICILFLDPRSDIVPRLAKEELQSPKQMLADITTSIGICRRLYTSLQNEDFPSQTQLHVCVYDEIPYFAYHKADNMAIVGFYFPSALGWESPAFEVVDELTRKSFENHFTGIFERASGKVLLELSARKQRLVFNKQLYESIYSVLVKTLGKEKTDELISQGQKI